MLVSAPAGFGKTTLLSEWIYTVETAEQAIPTLFAWLSLDKGDNDPIRFWAYVVAALREVRLDIGEAALTILQSPALGTTALGTTALGTTQPATASAPHDQVEWIETILTDLINELAEASPAPLVLVLDDLHLIENP
jgi:LuxR family maltose regulon positive regulatory protein